MSDLEEPGRAPEVSPAEEPPETAGERETRWVADHTTQTRDATPATGHPGEPGRWQRAREGAKVGLARPEWGDAVWSFIFKGDTDYATAEADPERIAAGNRAARAGTEPGPINGPIIHAPVWTWEVPTYFWVGGMAAGASFVGLAADIAGDHRSARIARKVSLGAVGPAPLLLIADLGRPARFLNMLRIFKPRSPMNLGAWCLMSFSATLTGAVGADLLRYDRTARALGGATAVLGGYLGSYTGVLLATTAVPLWSRSRFFLGPIFVATATATGAAATRLALVGAGLPPDHPTRTALARLETAAMVAELGLSTINEKRLGITGRVLEHNRHFKAAKWLVNAGFACQVLSRRRPSGQNVASGLFLAAGLAFRFAWVSAGRASAADDEAVAHMARGKSTVTGPREPSLQRPRAPRALSAPGRAYSAAVRRLSLLVEGLVRDSDPA